MSPTEAPRPGWIERLAARAEAANTAHIQRIDADAPNPRSSSDVRGVRELQHRIPDLAAEWEAFERRGGQLPLIEDLLGAHQGNVGSWWRVGPLLARRRRIAPLADAFPDTVAALLAVPSLRSAMISVLGPGAELPPHRGTSAGGLRLLVGIDSDGARLTVDGRPADLASGRVVLFDDTTEHSSRNDASERRVVLLCDVERPLPGVHGVVNAAVLRSRHLLTPRYRQAPARAAELHRQLNRGLG